mmetsp:Transcript_10009/g.24169  ORF Transcript_10009/g.24169 Transcript_10009/m.24169 type:complete len:437 (-) Transcript_10009:6-1316(-)
MADSPDAEILQKLLQPSPAAVASHLARQAAKAPIQRVQRVSSTDTDLYGWGLTQESAQELMHDLFDVVEEFPDMVAQLCHDLKKLGYFSGFPLPAERKDKFSGMEVISEREIKETAMAFLRRETATDSTDASSHEIRQVVQDVSSSSSKRRSFSKQRGAAAQSNGSRNTDTTLVMMNLPVDYSHEKSRGLVDSLGFRDRYDAVIWFPRKQVGHQNLSHAVVNFKFPEDCVAFRRRVRNCGINPSGEKELALTESTLQGFHDLFVKYWYMTQQKTAVVGPYFDKQALQSISSEDFEAAKKEKHRDVEAQKATTLVIRNLPDTITKQDTALKWLQAIGDLRGYDFFLFFPKPRAKSSTMAYAFVNFCWPSQLEACLQSLRGYSVEGSDPLNVVVAKDTQGLQACRSHFQPLIDEGRLLPVMRCFDEAAAEVPARVGYQ